MGNNLSEQDVVTININDKDGSLSQGQIVADSVLCKKSVLIFLPICKNI